MILYLDSSALVKLYVGEPESKVVRKLVASAKAVCTHQIAYVEICAAFGRALRIGRVARDAVPILLAELERDWENMDIIGVDEALIRRAGRLAMQFGLRGFDGVHLAAADTLARNAGYPASFRFAAFDTVLIAAADALGLSSA